ncbi:septal ring lytic transglycosylase RlpA family protein [Phaeodactylibacter luteus]|uniref:Probable endolytic peptidoglycan transglycosylase RlpA n=1 Tax=Phaeodactylibacter luteus TaxID=1564516 RepID=A0A5C6S4E9_9BACT|nr:septal ring lytic transglycosylase RlpA family protein [Phaeodactylibacter luteus]TXB68860.1 septal ring lytic transglycosylase RlpA family protein [Phaeodactylibacter luteus]
MKFPIRFLTLALLLTASTLLAQEEFGVASYYHDSFHGNETAYGVKYDKKQLTAAHRQHPFGTMLKVTRLDDNRSVVVKVTDKGPYKRGRIIDLSRAAAEKIGLIRDGLTEVKVEIVGSAPKTEVANKSQKTKEPTVAAKNQAAATAEVAKPAKKATAIAADTQDKGEAPAPKLVGKEYQKYGLYKVSIEQPGQTGFAVQVASLTNYENVFKQVADLQGKWFDNVLISIEDAGTIPIYKIMLGPFESEAAASNYRKNLQKKHKIKGFVVDLNTIEYNNPKP